MPLRILFSCLIVFLLSFLFPFAAFSQLDRIIALERQLETSKGEKSLPDHLELTRLYLTNNLQDKGLKQAGKLVREAERANRLEEKAMGLRLEATAMMVINPRKYKADIISKLQHSIKSTNNDELKKINAEDIRLVSTSQITTSAALTAGRLGLNATPSLGESTAENSEALIENLQTESKEKATSNEELRARIKNLSTERINLQKEQEQMARQLKEREIRINTMKIEEIRKEYLLLNKERALNDLSFRTALDSMRLEEQNLRLADQKSKLDLQKSERNLFLALAALLGIVAFGLFNRYNYTRRQNAVLEEKNKIIDEERKRSERLLLNILPAAVAEELKENGKADAREYSEVTVLFTDFVGFSNIASTMDPEKLVEDLDYCFQSFDKIIEKYQLEKIKTIGDSYMCAGGIPVPDPDHPRRIVQAALEIQSFLNSWKIEKEKRGEPFFEARIGIHTGPVVAGVVGKKKFAYDIWGSTVNIAARMETSSEKGMINISSSTYARVKDSFKCSYRGKIPAKNVGDIDMYFVSTLYRA